MGTENEYREHCPVDGQVPDELVYAEEPKRRVERDARNKDDHLRQRPGDQEHPEQDLDDAGSPNEIKIRHAESNLISDLKVLMLSQKIEGKLRVQELLVERNEDER